MATGARSNIDILVHVTAPSTGQHDAKYRALARAYLNFEPLQLLEFAHEHENEHDLVEDEAELANSQLQEELLVSTQEERESEASYRPADESESAALSSLSTQSRCLDSLLYPEAAFSQLSFDGVDHNLGSPKVRRPLDQSILPARSQDSQDSWIVPPSTVADSQPELQSVVGRFLSPGQALESILLQLQNSAQPPSSMHDGPSLLDQTKYPLERDLLPVIDQTLSPADDDLAAGEQSPQVPNLSKKTESTHPASYISSLNQPNPSARSISPSTSKRARSHSPQILRSRNQNIVSSQDNGVIDRAKDLGLNQEENHQSSSTPTELMSDSLLVSTVPFDSPRKRLRVEEFCLTTSELISSRIVAEVITPSSEHYKPMWLNKLEVRPPSPAVGIVNLAPESFITETLRKVGSKVPSTMYKPLEQKRELREMERGYWQLDCRGFNADLRIRCWERLAHNISTCRLGWGVWCVRDENLFSDLPVTDDLMSIRVYCWGITVDYLYLYLISISEKKIRGSGARWVGGDGQDIIIMD
jgi:hypothetical protein